MAKGGSTAEDKKTRESQAKDYKAADWAFVIKCTPTGGGAGRMVKRGK